MTRSRATARRTSVPAPESRALVLAAVTGVAIGLMAFVLGMNYGLEKVARGVDASPPGESVLGRLDRQAERLREVRRSQSSALSFHEALSGPARPPKPAAPRKPAVPDPVEPASPSSSPAAPPQGAVAELAAPATVAPEVAAVAPETARYSLQVGAFPEPVKAQELADKLSARGHAVRIVAARVNDDSTWYRVRVGAFADRAQAEAQRSVLTQQDAVFALVVPEGGGEGD